jgi:hypothetical protein
LGRNAPYDKGFLISSHRGAFNRGGDTALAGSGCFLAFGWYKGGGALLGGRLSNFPIEMERLPCLLYVTAD